MKAPTCFYIIFCAYFFCVLCSPVVRTDVRATGIWTAVSRTYGQGLQGIRKGRISVARSTACKARTPAATQACHLMPAGYGRTYGKTGCRQPPTVGNVGATLRRSVLERKTHCLACEQKNSVFILFAKKELTRQIEIFECLRDMRVVSHQRVQNQNGHRRTGHRRTGTFDSCKLRR